MFNPDMFVVPLSAQLVTNTEAFKLDGRRKNRLAELDAEGWAPSAGWVIPPRKCAECGRPHRVEQNGSNYCMSCWRKEFGESDV